MIPCDVEGCGYQAKNEMGLMVHKTRKHGGNKKTKPRKSSKQPGENSFLPDGTFPHFCPNCGTDLDAIRRAVGTTQRAAKVVEDF